jgi:hypothetical protein|tara:strand:- start:285 stop:920 length:636 start_codon:yes stop_codon:yes gene_type:complete
MDSPDNTNNPNNTKKTINIQGTGTRYMMNKVTMTKKVNVEKKLINELNIDNTYLYPEHQLSILIEHSKNETKLEDNIQSQTSYDDDHTVERKRIYDILLNEVSKKLGSYKQQDKVKKVYDEDKNIDLMSMIALLCEKKLTCYYCEESCCVLYKIQRESKQWTLDRIDNDIGHYKENVVVSCLECNLKKRRRTKEDFLFTKQLRIAKLQGEK